MVCIAVLFILKYSSAFHSHKRTQWTLIRISVHSIRRSNVINHTVHTQLCNYLVYLSTDHKNQSVKWYSIAYLTQYQKHFYYDENCTEYILYSAYSCVL